MIGVSLIKKLMRYEIVYGSRDIYVIRKIKEDWVRGPQLRIDKKLNFLYN